MLYFYLYEYKYIKTERVDIQMKNNIIKYTAILLSFATIIILFAACAKEEQVNEYMLIKDDKIYYRKNDKDDYYELVTDKEGVTVVDENGNLLWKVTDSSGKDQTHPVSYPLFLIEGEKMSCQQFTITCPKGWESTGNINFMMKNVKENKMIEYSYLEKTDKNYSPFEEEWAKFEESFKPMVEEGTAKLTRSNTQIAGRDAIKVIMEINNDGATSYLEIYNIEDKGGRMTFRCSCDYTEKGYDFKAILDTIEYRY